MKIVHVELSEANDFVAIHHRHHKPVPGHRFSLGALKNSTMVGVCIVGRPVARMTDQKNIVEVTRLCTDGSPNACSALYAAAARAAKELGFQKIQTFILESEPGTSLKASGWAKESVGAGGSWNRPSRGGRREDQPQEPKVKWSKALNASEVVRQTYRG